MFNFIFSQFPPDSADQVPPGRLFLHPVDQLSPGRTTSAARHPQMETRPRKSLEKREIYETGK